MLNQPLRSPSYDPSASDMSAAGWRPPVKEKYDVISLVVRGNTMIEALAEQGGGL